MATKYTSFVSSDEYDKVVSENIELRAKIIEISQNERILNEIIEGNKKTIEELKKENDLLKEKLTKFEKDNQLSNDRIKKLENKQIYEKYIVAIQDINRLYKLESVLKNDGDIVASKRLKHLRQDRVGSFHYIYENEDTVDETQYKINLLHKKLISIPEDIKTIFDTEYENLIDIVIDRINTQSVKIDDDDKDFINKWWTK